MGEKRSRQVYFLLRWIIGWLGNGESGQRLSFGGFQGDYFLCGPISNLDNSQGWVDLLFFRGTSSSQWESERPPPCGPHTRALHRRGPACLRREQWRQGLHGHQPCPTARGPGPSPPHAHRRPVWLALCFRETRLEERLQPHRWVEPLRGLISHHCFGGIAP